MMTSSVHFTDWVRIEESTGSSKYLSEDCVVESYRGRHTHVEKVDGSNHGEDHETQHYGREHSGVEEVVLHWTNTEARKRDGVAGVGRRWRKAEVWD